MTAADLPTTHGIPNNGGEGFRFLGYPAYDSIINWDFTHTDKLADITPGLFTAWHADETNPLRWICDVRQGVKFHDGSEFNADAVIWNLRRIYDDKSPQYDAPAAPIVRATVSMVDAFEKADDKTIVITTKYPFSFLPYLLTRVLIASPTQWEKVARAGRSSPRQPSGTGPFKITKVVPGQYAEMSRNEDYWDKARIPEARQDGRLSDAGSHHARRGVALRPGGLDRGAAAGRDPVAEAGGVADQPVAVSAHLSLRAELPGRLAVQGRARAPGDQLRHRPRGHVQDAERHRPSRRSGLYPPDNPIFGTPKNRYGYDPERAKALLKEAGYGPDKPVKAKIMISTSGSGQMMPIPMNEFMQQNFKAVGMDIEFDVVEWGTMLVAIRNAPTAPQSHGDRWRSTSA